MKTKPIILLIAIVTVALLLETGVQARELKNPQTTFTVTQLSSNAYANTEPAIAIDSNGYIHVAYIINGYTYYLNNLSGSWVGTFVGDPGSEFAPSIAVDANGKVHIAFFSGTSSPYDLYYISNASGIWDGVMLGNITCPGADRVDGGIAVDGNGYPYVVYTIHDGNDYEIEMRYYDGTRLDAPDGGWTTEIITDNTNDDDGNPSIAIDASNNVHIAFDSYTGDFMKGYDIFYATNASGSWTQSTVVSQDDTDRYPSIAVDGNGKAHIAYYHFEMAGNSVQYASNTSGSWKSTSVADNTNDLYFFPSIALDPNGKVHIAYETSTSSYHMGHVTNASGTWVITDMNVTSSNTMSSHMDRSIAIDPSGYVHIIHSGDSSGKQELYLAKSDQSFSGGGSSQQEIYLPFVGK